MLLFEQHLNSVSQCRRNRGAVALVFIRSEAMGPRSQVEHFW